MDGVTIISTETIGASSQCNVWWVSIILFCFIVIPIVIQSYLEGRRIGRNTIIAIVVGLVISIPIGVYAWYNPIASHPEYIIYTVELSDNVSMTEFESKYEIQEQRGNLYIVKDITN